MEDSKKYPLCSEIEELLASSRESLDRYAKNSGAKLISSKWNEDIQKLPSHPDWLYINAVRYAIGRKTYVVSETTEWIRANYSRLSQVTKEQIYRDLRDAILKDLYETSQIDKGHEMSYRHLGHDCDRKDWWAAWKYVCEVLGKPQIPENISYED